MVKTLKRSPFGNTYGGLDLVETGKGKFLEMEDCFGPMYYGPITEEQERAFNLLCAVEVADGI